MAAPSDSDETLYHRVKRGDAAAFDALYARYSASLFGFLVSQVRDRAEAEDVFHETFLAALKSREVTFDGAAGGSFRVWLFRIARNLVLNQRRKRVRGRRAVDALPAPPPEPSAEERMTQGELGLALARAVEKLPPGLHEVYHLRASGLPYEEMAAVLGVPLGTLKSRMHQMVATLREELVPWTAA